MADKSVSHSVRLKPAPHLAKHHFTCSAGVRGREREDAVRQAAGVVIAATAQQPATHFNDGETGWTVSQPCVTLPGDHLSAADWLPQCVRPRWSVSLAGKQFKKRNSMSWRETGCIGLQYLESFFLLPNTITVLKRNTDAVK